MPPPPLRADLIVRWPSAPGEPSVSVPVRTRLGGDLRFFLAAWALGFVAFFAMIA